MNEIWKQWEGQVVNGKFPLRKFLGGSGHGIVFLTERAGAETQKAAIKLVLEVPGQTEARLAVWEQIASLSHPNLLQIYESGRCQLGETALLFVVMEYAEEDLSQILPLRALSPAEARELIPPVVNALTYLHGQGFVHGHLKPANIMAVADQVKLSSDGLCAVAGASAGWDHYPGMDIYDPVYDPPEAEKGALTAAADIWSLGVILVEALTLRRRIWDRTGRAGVEEYELILPDGIPEPFLDIVRNCLIPDARLRWVAGEVASRLQGRAVPSKLEMSRQRSRENGQAGRQKKTLQKALYPVVGAVALVLVVLLGARMRRPALPHFEADQAQVEGQSQSQSQSQNPPVQAVPAQPKAVQPKPIQRPSASNPEVKPSTPAPSRTPVSTTGRANGAVLHQVLPTVSDRSRRSIEGHVRVAVKVSVDASGNVKNATLDSAGPSQYFARQALQSVREWKFTPPHINGQAVPSEWLLKFSFSGSGTDVRPAQLAP